jgi:anti-sigma factor RsiW
MTAQPGHRIPEAELMAYLDRSLNAARAAEVEAALEADPEARARLAEWQHQNAMLGALYPSTEREPLPPRLNPRRMAAVQTQSRHRWQSMAAAAILCLGLGGAGGWYLGQRNAYAPGAVAARASDTLMAEAVTAHRLYAADIAHPVQISGNPADALGIWLSKRLDRKLTVPNLERSGWRLIGGNLVPAGNAAGAQIMYEDTAGQRLTLFFTPAASVLDGTPRFMTAGNLDVMNWADARLNCTIVGPVGRQDIKRIAAEVYDQLT